MDKNMWYIEYDQNIRDAYKELGKFVKNKRDLNELIRIRNFLTPFGFEIYIREFFKRPPYGFSTYPTGGYNDKGIDIKGVRKIIQWQEEYLAIQCKKWTKNHIRLDDLTSWYGKVADLRHIHKNLYLVYVTTSWATIHTKNFAEEKSIHFFDYKDTIEMTQSYAFEEFYEDVQNIKEYSVSQIFTPYFLECIQKRTSYIQQKKVIQAESKVQRSSPWWLSWFR